MPAIVTKCVIVLLVLLPLKGLALPLTMAVVDVWAAFTLPLCWVVLSRQASPFRLPYLPAFLLILFATVLASLLSADPVAGLIVALKDVYLYVWLVTLAAVFENVDARDHRALLAAWSAAVGVHAALIVAQFLHPPLLSLVSDLLSGAAGVHDNYRPSGVSGNSNAAATFQVLGFVPLVLWRPRVALMVPLILLNTAAVVCTGSMGAAVALASGGAAGLVVVMLFSADMRTLSSIVFRSILAAGLCLVAVLLLLRGGAEFTERFESMSWGRSERSAAGRFELWDRGADTLMSEFPVWGIGPDRFQQLEGSEMHNDLLGFAVERGLLGVLGLCLLGAMAVVRSIELFRIEHARGRLRAVVFPAALAASMAASLTHEVFHSRVIWLTVAVQEALLWRARRARPG
ncbi:MAG: O-antigen ligase family protein [Planctomycetota bacterium]|jgi:hypothetical protein